MMKAFLIIFLTAGALMAEHPDWEVVAVSVDAADPRAGRWAITIQNRSNETRKVTEDWRFEGKASANYFLSLGRFGPAGMKLFAEPCHTPQAQARLEVGPGEEIQASIPIIRREDQNNINMAIIVGGERVFVASLGEINKNGQQAGADQPATASGSKLEGNENPKPESGVRSQ